MLAYIKFDTSEEFENWQSVKERIIHQAQPIVNELDVDSDSDSFGTTEVKAQISFGIFVLYFKDENECN